MSAVLSLVTTPISAAAPFGANINYEPLFDTLKNEMNKPGNLDLGIIEECSTSLLKSKAKDVRVMSFLAYVYLRKDRWEELADLFAGLAALCVKDFDALQPDRERAKHLGFKWLAEDRFTGALDDKKPDQKDHDHIVRLRDALDNLKPMLENKFPDSPPFPLALIKQALFWEKASAPPPPAAAIAAAGTAATGTAPIASAAPAADTLDTPKQAQALGRKAALFLVEKEPLKSMGYRLMRAIRWDILEKMPPAEAGKTQLPGPAAQQRTYLENLVAQREWKTALEKAENAFAAASNHLWLDLQRIIVTAAANLGEPYAGVRSAVLSETAFFVRRLPGVVTLCFSDDTPFCNEATRAWLATEAPSASSSEKKVALPPAAAVADLVEEDLRKADALVGAGKLDEAIDLMQGGIRASRCERDSFRRSIAVASLLLKAQQPDIAVSVLEMVDRKATDYNIGVWEPDLAVEAWSALVGAYKAAKTGKPQNILVSLQDRQNSILTKVSCIDPKKALQLTR
jgi:type VI secretion system protein VasJ